MSDQNTAETVAGAAMILTIPNEVQAAAESTPADGPGQAMQANALLAAVMAQAAQGAEVATDETAVEMVKSGPNESTAMATSPVTPVETGPQPLKKPFLRIRFGRRDVTVNPCY